MKHAYLILAHHEFDLLQCLLTALDDERNDIYVHVDRKVRNLPDLHIGRAGLFFTEDRVDVRWGDISVVEAEYVLFEEAIKKGAYTYYHLLSGVDMPLKGQDEIHRFFERYRGKEFIGFSQYDYKTEVLRKVQKYHLFPRDFKKEQGRSAFAKRVLRFLWLRLQDVAGYERHRNIAFKKGTQWVSVTGDFLKHLVLMKADVLKMYNHSFCSDEIYKQTLCWNSLFRNRIYDAGDEAKSSLRKIGWQDGKLQDWTMQDYDVLRTSDALFARKFNHKHIDVVHRLLNDLTTWKN